MKTQHCITDDAESPLGEPISAEPIVRAPLARTSAPEPRKLGNVIAWRMELVDPADPQLCEHLPTT